MLGRKRQGKGLDLGTVQTCGPAGVSIYCDFRAPPSFQIFLGQRKFASVLSSSWNDLPMEGPRARGSHWLETHRSHIHDAFEPDRPKGVRVPHLWVITPRLMELGDRPSQSQRQAHACPHADPIFALRPVFLKGHFRSLHLNYLGCLLEMHLPGPNPRFKESESPGRRLGNSQLSLTPWGVLPIPQFKRPWVHPILPPRRVGVGGAWKGRRRELQYPTPQGSEVLSTLHTEVPCMESRSCSADNAP